MSLRQRKLPSSPNQKLSSSIQPLPSRFSPHSNKLKIFLGSILLFILLYFFFFHPIPFHVIIPSLFQKSYDHNYIRRVRLLPYNQTVVKKFKAFMKNKQLSEQDLQSTSFKMGSSGVRQVLRERNYREVFDSDDWDILWTGKSQYRFMDDPYLHPHQRCSNCAGPGGIAGNKINHWKFFKALQDTFGKDEFHFVLTSYILPKENKELTNKMQQEQHQRLYIAKPALGRQGEGIYLFRDQSMIPQGKYIVQEYLEHPYLIQQRKFHLRIYLFVRSLKPLRIYTLQEGLALFSSQPYAPEDLDNLDAHLTNAAVGKKVLPSEEWEVDNDDRSHLTWRLSYFYRYLEHEMGVNVTKVKSNIADVLVKSVLTAQAFKPFTDRTPGTCFDIYGADIMLDEFLEPYVAEINLGPELKLTDNINGRVHKEVISSILDIIEYHPTNKQDPHFNEILKHLQNEGELFPNIVDEIWRMYLESKHYGKFESLYPCSRYSDREKYLQYYLHGVQNIDLLMLQACKYIQPK